MKRIVLCCLCLFVASFVLRLSFVFSDLDPVLEEDEDDSDSDLDDFVTTSRARRVLTSRTQLTGRVSVTDSNASLDSGLK